jgi:hypothetical protein
MTGLVLKLSYNKIGDSTLEGGICGSFFVLKPNLAITANHVLNKQTFIPNPGFKYCQLWLIIEQNTIIEIFANNCTEHSEIDTTFINLKNSYPEYIRPISNKNIEIGIECKNEGFIGGTMPVLEANWSQTRLVISNCTYEETIANGKGHIKSKKIMNVNANDIKMTEIYGLETSYGGTKGMSGGPLINLKTDEIVGLMSIGLPADVQIKKTLFAVSIKEIMKKLENVA